MKPAQCWQSNTRKAPDPFLKGDILVQRERPKFRRAGIPRAFTADALSAAT
jgi:hypothetical protein